VSTHYTLRIPRNVLAGMGEQAVRALPNECCGLLAGRLLREIAEATRVFPLVNDASQASHEYRSESRSILAAHKAMRDEGLDLVAIYHSHPTSAAVPSRKDLADNAYGDSVMHLIISLQTGQPEVRGWWLGEADSWPGCFELPEAS